MATSDKPSTGAGEESASENPAGCDRRMSRAARELLKRDASAILRRHVAVATKDPKRRRRRNKEESLDEVWSLVEKALEAETNTKCVLDPQLDLFRRDEMHSRLPAVTTTGWRQSPPRKYARAETLYTCEYSGKSFYTRYYLDRHMNRRYFRAEREARESKNETTVRAADTSTEEAPGMFCPADEWCSSIFTQEDCVRVALEQEPFYGRGSGDSSSKHGRLARDQFRRDWLQLSAKPCREEAMVEQGRRCAQVLQDCFASQSELRMDLQAHFCERLTCHWRLQRMAFAFFSSATSKGALQVGHHHHHVHQWYDLWHDEHTTGAHRSTWIAIVFVVVLAVFYGFRLAEWAMARWTRLLNPLLLLLDKRAPKRRPNSAAFWRKEEEQKKTGGAMSERSGLRRRRMTRTET